MKDLEKIIDNKYTLTEVISKRARNIIKEVNDEIKKAEKDKNQELVYELNENSNSIGYKSINQAIKDLDENRFTFKIEE